MHACMQFCTQGLIFCDPASSSRATKSAAHKVTNTVYRAIAVVLIFGLTTYLNCMADGSLMRLDVGQPHVTVSVDFKCNMSAINLFIMVSAVFISFPAAGHAEKFMPKLYCSQI
jgi:hypothetical protein